MTDDELKALETLADTATPGPWHHSDKAYWACVMTKPGDGATILSSPTGRIHDAAFAAAARTAVPALIAEVRRLKALGTSCKHRSGTCKWCHGPVGTPRPDHVCESE